MPDRNNLKPGQPCKRPGCLSHISHPCEGCGRIGGFPPAPTLPQAVEVLNKNKYGHVANWEAVKIGTWEGAGCTSRINSQRLLTEFEVIAMAEKYQRQKEES